MYIYVKQARRPLYLHKELLVYLQNKDLWNSIRNGEEDEYCLYVFVWINFDGIIKTYNGGGIRDEIYGEMWGNMWSTN